MKTLVISYLILLGLLMSSHINLSFATDKVEKVTKTKICKDIFVTEAILVRELKSQKTPHQKKMAILDDVIRRSRFSDIMAWGLLEYLDIETNKELKNKAAHAFYLLFYDVKNEKKEVFEYLMNPKFHALFKKHSYSKEDLKYRVDFIQTGQVLLFSYDGIQADVLARTYAPMIIPAILDPHPIIINEAIIALTNMAEKTEVLQEPEIQKQLQDVVDILKARLPNLEEDLKEEIESFIEIIEDEFLVQSFV